MPSNYRPIGQYIRLVDIRNRDLRVTHLLGVSITKQFIPSVANIIGTDMANYKIIRKNQFACSTMQVRRDKKMPVALLKEVDEAIISQAYPVFEVIDENELLPEYLMMWFTREEFDREACFYAVGGVRGSLEWEDFLAMQLPIPSPAKQREIVTEYHAIQNRIALNNQLIQKLETTAQAIYKQWFVEFEFPNESGQPYKSSGGEMVDSELGDIPKGWEVGNVGKYAKVKSGFAFASECWGTGDIPVIKIGSIQKNTIDPLGVEFVSEQTKSITKNYKVAKGDLVIAMTGATIGKIGLVPRFKDFFLVNQRVGMFDLGYAPLSKVPFLYCTLLQDYFQNEIINTGGDSAQQNVSNKEIEKIRLLLPSTEQLSNYNLLAKPFIEMVLNKMEGNHLLENLSNILLSKLSTIEAVPSKLAAPAPSQLTLAL